MKFATVLSLLSVLVLTACETTQTQTTTNAVTDGITVTDDKTNLKDAAEKRLALGMGYVQRGLMERAKKNLLMAEKHAPDMPDVMFGLAYYYQKVFEFDKAERYYQKALDMDENNPDYMNAYGAFLCTSKKDYEGAVKYFLKAVDQPEYIAVGESYENAGFCSIEAGDHEKAELYFKKAMTFNPRLTKPLYGLALMSFEANEYNKAETYLLQFEGKSKPSADSLLLGYKIGRRLNDRFSMESYGEKLIQLFPRSEQARIYKRMSS
ncbi:type IV pilus biogenesis/stability protein PilW [Kangiella sp. TOML190]|uniref:type IV pilus biogenesis/stability protein PilW n=1 Tax=Kangiella sp. TOML190 TaxID=2931351 RepID=UPI00203D8238|nr:type IV pilus biogenesis/stability protein PilW [Kangiella sp. TOML190]